MGVNSSAVTNVPFWWRGDGDGERLWGQGRTMRERSLPWFCCKPNIALKDRNLGLPDFQSPLRHLLTSCVTLARRPSSGPLWKELCIHRRWDLLAPLPAGCIHLEPQRRNYGNGMEEATYSSQKGSRPDSTDNHALATETTVR